MDYRLDEIDKRILFHLSADARNTTAPTIAEEVDVTAATIRHRIRQLEEHGIIRGYHADIDYERTDGYVVNQFRCTVPVSDRQRYAQEVLQISGVVNVQELMSGRENLVVTAVGKDTDDITRIARDLSDCGLELEREDIVQNEWFHPYHPFSPENGHLTQSLADIQNLAGGAEIVEFTVPEDATITGKTLQEAKETDVLDDETLVISIERGDSMLTPRGETAVEAGDVITLFSRESVPNGTLDAFKTGATD